MSELGKPCLARQILAMPQVGLPQEKKIVELALFLPRAVALIFAELLVAQAFKRLTLSPRLPKDFLLLIAQRFEAQEFPLR